MCAGRTELALSIFGKSYGTKIPGTIEIDGKAVAINNVGDAINHKIAYATEDRKTAGLVLIDTIKRNISLVALKKTY